MMTNRRHVVPRDDGWAVVAPGSDRASGLFDTQAEAIDRAREILQNSGGGELSVHRPSGEIRDGYTIGRPDPYPPKG